MELIRRRALGIGATTGLVMVSGKVSAADPQNPGDPRSEPQDSWLDEGGRRHRIAFDTLSTPGLGLGMNFAKNFFVANHDGYGIGASELSVVVVLRHLSTAFAFNDAIWARHGDYLGDHVKVSDPRTKEPPRVNVFNVPIDAPGLPNGKVTLGELSKLGARFAVCAMAASKIAKAITENSHDDSDALLKELEANLVPNALMVPAGIVAVNRAQEHGYAFSYCG